MVLELQEKRAERESRDWHPGLTPVVSTRVQPLPHRALRDTSRFPVCRVQLGRGGAASVWGHLLAGFGTEVSEAEPWGTALSLLLSRELWLGLKPEAACRRKTWKRTNSALTGFGEEQQMHGVQSQLDLTNCGILDKSFPSQNPPPPRQTHTQVAGSGA